jgi:hypothetical protein
MRRIRLGFCAETLLRRTPRQSDACVNSCAHHFRPAQNRLRGLAHAESGTANAAAAGTSPAGAGTSPAGAAEPASRMRRIRGEFCAETLLHRTPRQSDACVNPGAHHLRPAQNRRCGLAHARTGAPPPQHRNRPCTVPHRCKFTASWRGVQLVRVLMSAASR